VALPLTVAAHIANTLPDIETDRAVGRGSIVVRLGRLRALRLLALLLGVTVGFALQSARLLSMDPGVFYGTLFAYGVLVVAAGLVYVLGGRRRQSDVWGFRVVVVACLVFTGGWLAAVK
jgi:4-hydroxybenzoate polyprenyltransferase